MLFLRYQIVTKIKAFTQNHSVHNLYFWCTAPVLRSYSNVHCYVRSRIKEQQAPVSAQQSILTLMAKYICKVQ